MGFQMTSREWAISKPVLQLLKEFRKMGRKSFVDCDCFSISTNLEIWKMVD
jgi:hypothetical protein